MRALASAIVLACVLSAPAAGQSDITPDVVLSGRLSGVDHQTYRELAFDVPAGVTRVTVSLAYTGREEKTTIDLGLVDPDGIRGWSGGNKSAFTVSANDATPSYRAGPIRPGRWAVLLGIPNIRKASQAEYTAKIWFERSGRIYGDSAVVDPPLRAQPGWFRGDLHMHDAHSDGSCNSAGGKRVPCPVFLTAQTAAAHGLDFIAITDHNTVSQANAIRELQPYFDRTLLVPGREITTFSGHANLWGSVDPLDFRVSGGRDWNALLRDAAGLHGVVSINHPVRPSGETCMGCGWTPSPGFDPALVQAVEVVNGMDPDTPYSGIPFWEKLLDAGYRPTAVGGSDNHDAALVAQTPGSNPVARPTTVVHAPALSVPAILGGLRSGEVFIDVQGSRDRMLSMQARSGEASARMGGTLAAAAGDDVRIELHVAHSAEGRVGIVVDGKPYIPRGPGMMVKGDDAILPFAWRSDGGRHWLRAEVRGPDGKLWLLGNPVYINFKR